MSWLTLAAAVLGGAALATVLGKLIDLFWLEPRRVGAEHLRWLRKARLEAYTSLSEELLSMGLRTGIRENFQLVRAKAARAELLIDDVQLLQDLRKFSEDLFVWSRGGSLGTKVSGDPPPMELPDGAVATKKDVERSLDYGHLEDRANDLVLRLGKALRGDCIRR